MHFTVHDYRIPLNLMLVFIMLIFHPLCYASPEAKPFREFPEEFPTEYANAVIRAQAYESLLIRLMPDQAILPRIGISIVFPEMVRYLYIRDLAEIASMEFSYLVGMPVDFSIGPLQMKPSFALTLEKAKPLLAAQLFPSLSEYSLQQQRKVILNRLKNPEDQLTYLSLFLRYALERYPALAQGETEAIAQAAMLYNAGLELTDEEISIARSNNTFPFGPAYRGNQYNYADLVLGFYNSGEWNQ